MKEIYIYSNVYVTNTENGIVGSIYPQNAGTRENVEKLFNERVAKAESLGYKVEEISSCSVGYGQYLDKVIRIYKNNNQFDTIAISHVWEAN